MIESQTTRQINLSKKKKKKPKSAVVMDTKLLF